MADPTTARSYGQALLDVVSSHDTQDSSLLDFAGKRVHAIGGGRVSLQGQGQGLEVDLNAALGGSLTLVGTLVTMLRECSGRQDHEILDEVRRRFDRACRV
ncbi:hypothetical protein GCM10009817_30750 [Terrabacter lapilli]|uniref:Uncharacterized protein n=1 Tax=Terrabacter lapilli TaxID=436231 RepID=A0ABP5DVK5_9MICO